jgi:(p)ppGpp synthase/HD superfamily hydrolase
MTTKKAGEMLSLMLLTATHGHKNQYDKGGNPYILHPLKVMYYLKSTDEELMCIALGHDLVEDTDTTFHDLRQLGMSERIVQAIDILTKKRGQTYEEYKLAVFSNIDAMKVKLCDLRHNSDFRRLKGVTDKDVARMAKYMQFFDEITKKLQEGNNV